MVAGPCSGMRAAERVVDLVHHGELARLAVLPLRVPALELALDVALGAAQVAQADGHRVDGVDAGQDLGELAPGVRPRLGGQAPGRLGVAGDEPLHEAHDVERRPVHGLVGAQADRRRHRHVGGGQGGDDAMLAAHVVGGGQHLAQRGAAQHPGVVGGVGHPEGQVRAAARDELEGQRRLDLGRVRLEPLGDPGDIDPAGAVGGVGGVGGGRVGHRGLTVEAAGRRGRRGGAEGRR